MTQLRAADAGDRPCQVRTSHNPTPVRTQSHHRYPEYLQRRLWGVTRIQDRWDCCGTDHDSIHSWLGAELGEQARPTLHPGRFVVAEVERVLTWYRAEQEKLSPYGGGAYGAGAYGADDSAHWDGVE